MSHLQLSQCSEAQDRNALFTPSDKAHHFDFVLHLPLPLHTHIGNYKVMEKPSLTKGQTSLLLLKINMGPKPCQENPRPNAASKMSKYSQLDLKIYKEKISLCFIGWLLLLSTNGSSGHFFFFFLSSCPAHIDGLFGRRWEVPSRTCFLSLRPLTVPYPNRFFCSLVFLPF